MTRRALTAAAIALAVVYGAAMGREAARMLRFELDYRARRRGMRAEPESQNEHKHEWIEVTTFADRVRQFECLGRGGCGAKRAADTSNPVSARDEEPTR